MNSFKLMELAEEWRTEVLLLIQHYIHDKLSNSFFHACLNDGYNIAIKYNFSNIESVINNLSDWIFEEGKKVKNISYPCIIFELIDNMGRKLIKKYKALNYQKEYSTLSNIQPHELTL